MTLPTTRKTIATMTVGLGVLIACSVGSRAQGGAPFSPLPLKATSPADNPSTPEKVALGRFLFWDPVLSGEQDIACATCHHPRFGYADGIDLAIGTTGTGMGTARRFPDGVATAFVKRNSPSILNTAFNGIDVRGQYGPSMAPMFWDGRVHGLESQALEPIKAHEEMRGSGSTSGDPLQSAVTRVAAIPEYRDLFRKAFATSEPISAVMLGKAIASYERSLVAADAPFDRYMRGDRQAMTPSQVRGMQAFQDAGCANCHRGPMFSDYNLHVLGVRDNVKLAGPDTGANETYAFRTPTLRNLAYTAPYMHNGVIRTLGEVVNFYNDVNGRGGRGGGGGRGGPGRGGPGRGGPGAVGNAPAAGTPAFAVVAQGGPAQGGPQRGGGGRGGRNVRNPNVAADQLDPLLRRVNIRNRRDEILDFLQALNSDFDRSIPDRVPSGRHPGGAVE